jgi:hypothetical protein
MKNAKALLLVSLLSMTGAALAGNCGSCCSVNAKDREVACTSEVCGVDATVPKKVLAEEADAEGSEVTEAEAEEEDVKE